MNSIEHQAAFAPGSFPSFKNAFRIQSLLDRCDETPFRVSVTSRQQEGKQVQRLKIGCKDLAKVGVRGVRWLELRVLSGPNPVHVQSRTCVSGHIANAPEPVLLLRHRMENRAPIERGLLLMMI
jgi:hypothetical protein